MMKSLLRKTFNISKIKKFSQFSELTIKDLMALGLSEYDILKLSKQLYSHKTPPVVFFKQLQSKLQSIKTV